MFMTGSQTVGPYLHIGLAAMYRDNLLADGNDADSIVISGQVIDADGAPVPDGMVEIWQADAEGIYPNPQDERATLAQGGFRGFGRVATDAEGRFRFTTIKPGRVPGPGGLLQASHIMVSVFARGLIKRLATRMYFPDDGAHADDPVLQLVSPERRVTLIARRAGDDARHYLWDVVIQGGTHGRDETVFFDV